MKSHKQRSACNLSLCVAVLTGGMTFAGDNGAPDWVLETEAAGWQARDSQGEVVFGDRMWIMDRGRMWVLGGWAKEPDNFADVWSSADGKTWNRLETKTCWKARHEHSAFVFRDKLWIAGGHARPLSSEVWSLQLPANWGNR